MRTLHEIAAVLGCTVGMLMGTLSAQEFVRWRLWLDAEQAGPAWAVRRHAELLAAVHNSGRVGKAGGGLFTGADFLPPDPWAPPPKAVPQTAEQHAAQVRAWIEAQIASAGA